MKKLIQKISNVLLIVALLTILVIISVLAAQYPLIKANLLLSTFTMGFIALFGGFAYRTEYYRHSDWSLGHQLKSFWVLLFIIVTAICIPIGLLLKRFYFWHSKRKDGSFNQKFYLFFNREEATI